MFRNDNYGHMNGWGWATTVSVLLLVLLIIVVAVMVLRATALLSQGPMKHERPSPDRMLAERFARGEIDEDEYHRRLAALHAPGRMEKDGPSTGK
ncbi:SHOCT domain-containing protein [Streptomyces sp. NPDC102467]|uniref:SHOCT domain-containing protein n=1 Tax=Streptomyces sp. NPDC102467 TaxID=3366179 RepID=UPI00382CA170